MKASVKAQWIADLRSGEFAQGSAYLESVQADGAHYFCCLGVLCRQAVRAGVIPEPELRANAYRYLDVVHDDAGRPTGEQAFNQCSSLPVAVSEWAGLGPDAGDIPLNPEQDISGTAAIEANDFQHLTFDQIADLVEQYVPVTE